MPLERDFPSGRPHAMSVRLRTMFSHKRTFGSLARHTLGMASVLGKGAGPGIRKREVEIASLTGK
jgi:hypothetical protein